MAFWLSSPPVIFNFNVLVNFLVLVFICNLINIQQLIAVGTPLRLKKLLEKEQLVKMHIAYLFVLPSNY